jgi:hypothetical protein
MARTLLAPALALGATILIANGVSAEERGAPAAGFTMTLAGKGTAAEAATSTEDIEEAWHRGYYGWGGGWGGYRWGPYRNYLLFHPFRPFVNVRKAVFNPFYYGPGYSGGYGGGYAGYCCYNGWGGGFGGYNGINGIQDDAAAPAVSLNLAIAKRLGATTVARTDAPAIPGTFRYDGGPVNPVPDVKPDAEPRTARNAASDLPVSLKKENPYRYKAYGEK